ncbi:MAG: hypothetical protein WDN28_30795 [Chthoniobacter sp.]
MQPARIATPNSLIGALNSSGRILPIGAQKFKATIRTILQKVPPLMASSARAIPWTTLRQNESTAPRIATKKIVSDRKVFVLDLKENHRGRFLKITEDVGGRRDRVMLPAPVLSAIALFYAVHRLFRAQRKGDLHPDEPGSVSHCRGRHQNAR